MFPSNYYPMDDLYSAAVNQTVYYSKTWSEMEVDDDEEGKVKMYLLF